MKKRKFILGLGTVVGTGSIIGSGAFTSTSAARRLVIQTAGDNNALLRLKQRGDGYRSSETDTPEKVSFSFPGWEERVESPNLGLGADSVYEFDRDADESGSSSPTQGLLRIQNQGTQPVAVYSEHETDSELEIELYDVTDDSETALRDDPPTLDVGDSVDVGFRIRTHGASVGEFEETLTIVANQPDQ